MAVKKIEDQKSRQRINKVMESIQGLTIREAKIFLESAQNTVEGLLSNIEHRTEIKTDNSEFQDLIRTSYENWLYL